MKKIAFLLAIFCFLHFHSSSQNVHLTQGDTAISPLYSKDNLLQNDTIRFKLHLSGNVPNSSYPIPFSLDNASIKHGSKPILPANANTIQISQNRWNLAIAANNTIDTFLIVQLPATTDTLKKDEIARISIINQSNEYIQVRISSLIPTPKISKIALSQFTNDVDIVPFEDDIDTPKKDSLKVNLKFTGSYSVNNNIAHFYLSDTSVLTNKVQILNPNIFIDSTTWNTNTLDTFIYIYTKPVIDTGTFKSVSLTLKLKEDTLNSIPIWITYKGKKTWYKKSNFFIGSFIKSISGTTAQNELLDIFLKVNLTSKKGLDSGKGLMFGYFGADAGISSDTVGKKGAPLNKAMVSVN